MRRPTILFVDDDLLLLQAIARAYRKKPFEVVTVNTAENAIRYMKSNTVHVVISDEMMKGLTGTDLLDWVAEWCPKTMRIMLTGKRDMESCPTQQGLFRFLTKPINELKLATCIYDALDEAGLDWKVSVAAY